MCIRGLITCLSHFKDSPKIIVGGAPVTEVFAKKIRADVYGKDVVDGVVKIKNMVN